MNGWERIGVILSVLFGVPSFLIAFDTNKSAEGFVTTIEKFDSIDNQKTWNTIYLAANAQNPDRFKNCIPNTLNIKSYGDGFQFRVRCDHSKFFAFRTSAFWAFIPGIFLFLLGYLVAWVRAGFEA